MVFKKSFFYIACGYRNNTVFRSCLDNFCTWLKVAKKKVQNIKIEKKKFERKTIGKKKVEKRKIEKKNGWKKVLEKKIEMKNV